MLKIAIEIQSLKEVTMISEVCKRIVKAGPVDGSRGADTLESARKELIESVRRRPHRPYVWIMSIPQAQMVLLALASAHKGGVRDRDASVIDFKSLAQQLAQAILDITNDTTYLGVGECMPEIFEDMKSPVILAKNGTITIEVSSEEAEIVVQSLETIADDLDGGFLVPATLKYARSILLKAMQKSPPYQWEMIGTDQGKSVLCVLLAICEEKSHFKPLARQLAETLMAVGCGVPDKALEFLGIPLSRIHEQQPELN